MPWRSSSPLRSERLLHSVPSSLYGSMSVSFSPSSSWLHSFVQAQSVSTLMPPLLPCLHAHLDKWWIQPLINVRTRQQVHQSLVLRLYWQPLPQLQVLQEAPHLEVQPQQCLRWTKVACLPLNRSHPRKITVWADLLFLPIKQWYIFWTTTSSFWERCSSFSIWVPSIWWTNSV